VPKFLDKIQSWPSGKKKKAVAWGAILAMVVIIMIWLTFFNNLPANAGSGASFWGNAIGKAKEIINNYGQAK